MSRYRILRMITWLPRGGIERKIAAVLPRLDRNLFDVHLCCIRERGPLADEVEAAGIPVHLIPFRGRLDPIGLIRLRTLIKQLRIDLIHSHMYRSNVPATLVKLWDPKLIVVGHYHNMDTWETKRQLWMDGWLARRRDLNVAVSDAVRVNIEDRLNLPLSLVRTLRNCVDLDEFRPALRVEERNLAREKLGIPTHAKVIMMVGRLVRQKNQDLAIRALRDILRVVTNAHLVLVGGGPDELELRELATGLKVQEAVIFTGSRSDVPEILRAADICVLPSLKEGFSNAILESMASGVPMVASDVGGNREIIDQGTNGFLCDVTGGEVSMTQFIRYVTRLLNEDDFCERAGAAALVTAQRFGIDKMVHEIEQLYLDFLGGENPDGETVRIEA